MTYYGECGDCGHRWTLQTPPEEQSDGPRCSECGERSDINVRTDGPGFDPDAAVGKGSDTGPLGTLEEALRATPGVGDAGVDYATYWFENGANDPEGLHDVLLEVDGVEQQAARRIVESVFGDQQVAGPNPQSFDFGDAGTGEGESFVDQLAKAKRVGLVGGDDGGSSDAEAIAQAVAEAVRPALEQVSQTQQMLAQTAQSEKGEVEELREEIRELREGRENEQLRELKEKVERLEADTPDDEEILKLRETRDMLENAPTVSAEAAEAWEGLAHSVLDRIKSHERQRALLGAPDTHENQPGYTPRGAAGQGAGPVEGSSGRTAHGSERPTPASPEPSGQSGTTAAADGGRAPSESGNSGGGGSGDGPQPVSEERAEAVRDKLGLGGGGDGE